MTTTLNHVRTIICASCGASFSYEYSGGRNRRKCDRSECDRSQAATRKRRSRDGDKRRPDGYRPADYPFDLGAPEGFDAEHFEATTEYHRHRPDRRAQTHSDDGGPPTVDRRSLPISRQRFGPGVSALLEVGHGYVPDDGRPRDGYPLRYLRREDKGFVKHWMREHSFPIAGMAGQPVRPGDDLLRVIGRGDESTDDVPARIARRFCSTDALSPLVTFLLICGEE
jgi:hypothetical protein